MKRTFMVTIDDKNFGNDIFTQNAAIALQAMKIDETVELLDGTEIACTDIQEGGMQ